MKPPAFFDTSILVYSDDSGDPEKKARAISLIAEHQRASSFVISLQVLQEYFTTVTKKLKMDADLAQRKVEVFARSHIVRFNAQDVIAAIELHRLNQISFWDAMIVHAARVARVSVLYSEDLAHGGTIAGVRVENPFVSM